MVDANQASSGFNHSHHQLRFLYSVTWKLEEVDGQYENNTAL